MAALLISGLTGAQETEVAVSLAPGYANQVFYKFSTNTQTTVPAASWDIAFQNVTGQQNMGTIRVNDAKGITLFQAANTAAGYSTVDVTTETTWTPLYNSEIAWENGAFNEGTAPYGWGTYNPVSHHVEGTIVYVLKYSATSYKKIFIQDYFGGFTFKYSTWNGTTWSADTINTVANVTPVTSSFNFFSLDTNATVTVAPADYEWDMVFTKYTSAVNAGGTTSMYPVTGALHNSARVVVAQVAEAGTIETPQLPAETAYSDEINTIGYDWKSFNMANNIYDINPSSTYYLKNIEDNSIYRLYFTSFAGGSTGNLTFNSENVATAGLDEVTGNLSFSVFPNPTTDGNVTLVYDLKNKGAENNTVSIYSATGAKVYETTITNNAGFYSKDLNLSALSGGIYMLKLQSGSFSQTKKLVIK